MKRHVCIAVVFALCCVISVTSCKKTTKQAMPYKRPLIGFSMDSFVEERRMRDRDVFLDTAARLGVDVNVQIGDEDSDVQEKHIRFLLDAGVGALVVIPALASHLSTVTLDARRKGIPVIAYERPILNANVNLFLAYNAEHIGALQAQAFIDKRKKGRIVIYNFAFSDVSSQAVHEGILKTLAPYIEKGDITIAADYEAQSRRSEEACAFMENLIQSGVRFDAVLAADDMAAEAVIRTLSLNRRLDSVFVAGVNADLAACQRIAEGSQSMTVYKPIDAMAAKAAELAVYLARGDRITVHNAMWDGLYRVPFYELEPISVTIDNLASTVIKDGLHLAGDVYRNVITN